MSCKINQLLFHRKYQFFYSLEKAIQYSKKEATFKKKFCSMSFIPPCKINQHNFKHKLKKTLSIPNNIIPS